MVRVTGLYQMIIVLIAHGSPLPSVDLCERVIQFAQLREKQTKKLREKDIGLRREYLG
jgi:hypothetical protein